MKSLLHHPLSTRPVATLRRVPLVNCASHIALALCICFGVFALGCGDTGDDQASPSNRLSVYPIAISMTHASGLSNRHDYEISGPDFDSPHQFVGDTIWRSALPAQDSPEANPARDSTTEIPAVVVDPHFDEPAFYTQGTPLRLQAGFAFDPSAIEGTWGSAPNDTHSIHTGAPLRVQATAYLRSKTDTDWPERVLFSGETELPPLATSRSRAFSESAQASDDAQNQLASTSENKAQNLAHANATWTWTLETDPLPDRIDLYTLEVHWTLTPLIHGDNDRDSVHASTSSTEPDFTSPSRKTWHLVTQHIVGATWRNPRPEAPRYKRALLWSVQWAAGSWTDGEPGSFDTRMSEHFITLRLLEGFKRLTDQGYSYGAFPRPDYDGTINGLDVFLDFKRSACGEFKHGLMGPIEYHGIDAKWVALHFMELDAEHYSFYKTRPVAALGREHRNWYDTNHAFVGVNDRIYDPTYGVWHESLAKYEDWMFEKYCLGHDRPCRFSGSDAERWCYLPPQDESTRCIDNPPGYDPDWQFKRFTGDGYR